MRFVLLFCLIVLAMACQNSPSTPDQIIHNAHILTMNQDAPVAQAMAILDDTIVAIGEQQAIMALAGPATRLSDLGGKTVVPGFIDAHCHPSPIYPFESIYGQVNVDPDRAPTMEALVAELKRKADITPENTWIRGGRYQHTKLGRHPNRFDLDKASTLHPITIRHSSGHLAVVNSLALELAGIDKNTPDPPGGAFDRDPDGTPNGVLRETAYSYVLDRTPAFPEPSAGDQAEGLLRKLNEYAQHGVTALSEAGIGLDKYSMYDSLKKEGKLPVRIQTMIREYAMDSAYAKGFRAGTGDDWLQIQAIKFYHGNSLSGQTCWLYEPYDIVNPETGEKDYYGIPPARSQQTLDSLVMAIHEKGYQLAIHCNGDREIDMVLDAIEKALTKKPRPDHRHRLEHGSIVNPQLLERMKQLEVVYAPHSYVYDHGDKMEVYGPERWDWMHANKSAYDLGIPVAGNSDEPVSAAIPMLRIQSMVTRTTAEGKVYGAKQKVSVEEALHIWTKGGAYALFLEDKLGSLEAGKKADWVVLDQNPLNTDAFDLKNISVLQTVVGGKVVFDESQKGN